MRVALVYPEVYDLARFREGRKEFPPFGVLYLAAVAREAGHDVSIDAVSPHAHALDLREAEVVAFSVPSSATLGVIADCRRASRLRAGALLLAGGVHANFYPEQTLTELDVDAVGVGEGEQTLLEVLECAERGEGLHGVAGLCLPDGLGGSARTPARVTMGRDISPLPLPARDLLPDEDVVMVDRLAGTDLRMAHVMFSRGCPFPCRFCAAGKTVIQYRSGASARAELEALIERYDIEGFAIVDDNFIVNPKKVVEICDAIADLGLKWSALSRVDRVTPELLATMRDAGCIELKFGMESGSAVMLEAMNKGGDATPDTVRQAVRWAREAGIGVKLFVIHGFPGETAATTEETRALLQELAPHVDRVSLFRFVPLPGTYVFEHPDEFDLVDLDVADWSHFHIHHNTQHWWGTEEQFAEVERSYGALRAFVDVVWPDRHAAAAR